jgi:hypothetical protein
MRRLLLILVLLLIGCQAASDLPKQKYDIGGKVYIPTAQKVGVVIRYCGYDCFSKSNSYYVRYANAYGELTTATLLEYELEAGDEAAHQGEQQNGATGVPVQPTSPFNLPSYKMVPDRAERETSMLRSSE